MRTPDRVDRSTATQVEPAHARVAIARAVRTPDGKAVEQPLMDHLIGVAERAETFCRPFGAADVGYLVGLWHDLGKYAPEWQRFIRQAIGSTDTGNAHLDEEPGRTRGPDHATAGGLHAIETLGPFGQLLAQVIVAHHSGLFDAVDFQTRIQKPDKPERLAAARAAGVPDAILRPPRALNVQLDQRVFGDTTKGAYALALRMVFSALVDADRLDSEAFGDPTAAALRRNFVDLDTLARDLDSHLSRFVPDTPVNRLRADVLSDCRRAAVSQPGLFTLTVPTGGGKTLSSLAFALAHARGHHLKRVIYVIPYTSIIEQTVDVFRNISAAFALSVVEHHSNVDEDERGNASEQERARLATENWDAPVVVTTSVQFFESLFAAKTSRARKLHNICESVVVLDEAQLLPPDFLQPIVAALDLLRRHYRTSIVLSTATQPALASRRHFGFTFKGLDDAQEIIADVDRLFRGLRRVDVRLPTDLNRPISWDEVGARIGAETTDVLAIVGRRADARALWRLLPGGAVHLSALMCGAHRSAVIDQIRRRLAERRADPSLPPLLTVSTQLVEAGVDIDFPVVYRAFAGLDSIAQAAGRCNREGRLPGLGRVEVFVPPKPAPKGTLRIAEDAAKIALHGAGSDALDRKLLETYFMQFYATHALDSRNIASRLQPAEHSFGVVGLRQVGEDFKLIDDGETGYRSVLVPYRSSERDETFAALIGTLAKQGQSRWLMRKLQRYAVSVPPHEFAAMVGRGDLHEVVPQCWVVRSAAQYRSDLGLIVTDDFHDPRGYVA